MGLLLVRLGNQTEEIRVGDDVDPVEGDGASDDLGSYCS